MPNKLTDFNTLIRNLARCQVSDSWEELGRSLSATHNGSSVWIYVFDMSVCAYRMCYGNKEQHPGLFKRSELTQMKELYRSEFDVVEPLYCNNGPNLIGVVFISDAVKLAENAQAYVDLMSFIYNRSQKSKFVEHINQPISTQLPTRDFYLALRQLASNCCSTEFGIYRRFENEELVSLFAWGLGDEFLEDAELNIQLTDSQTTYDAIVEKIPKICTNIPDTEPNFVKTHSRLSNAVSFCAIPVLVGDNVEGVLTIALTEEYDFSSAELDVFLGVANGLGISLSNYQLSKKMQGRVAEFEKLSSSLVGIEVAQSIRHSVLGASGNIVNALRSVVRSLPNYPNLSQKEKTTLSDRVNIAFEQGQSIRELINQMKDVMKVDRVVRMSTISEIWDDACLHLEYKLSESGVQRPPVSKGDALPLLEDMIKHIFHNLLLNSLDAFEGAPKKNRTISLRIQKHDKINRRLYLTYTDNGPGLNLRRLHDLKARCISDNHPVVTQEISIGEFIFQQDITTKKMGSGYGLFLCRRMAKYHAGGIRYETPSDGNGVLFRIELSYDLEAIQKQNSTPLYSENQLGELEELDVKEFVRSSP